MSVKVSIIIPIYNASKTLSKSIKSVTSQTLKDIEIICIDNNSKDNSVEIIKKLQKKDDRIRLLHEKEQGAGPARNKGLKHAKGEYVGFVDADDYVEKDYFEALYDTAKNFKADIARAYIKVDPQSGTTNSLHVNSVEYEEYYNNNLKNAILQNKFNQTSSACLAVYKRAMLNKYGLIFDTDIKAGEDTLFSIYTAYYANKIVYLNAPVYYLRTVRDGSSMTEYINTADGINSRVAVLSRAISVLNKFNKYPRDVYIRHVSGLIYFLRHRLKYVRYSKDAQYIANSMVESLAEVKYKARIYEELKLLDVAFSNSLHSKDILKQYIINISDMNKDKKFSIIVAVYNQEKYIRQCLTSILAQSFTNFELICIDDGSTDDSFAILKEFKSTDKRIKIITQTNSGAAVARNKGLEAAKGEYIIFLDSDDEFEDYLLEECLKSLSESPSDILVYNYISFRERNDRVDITPMIINFDNLPSKKVYNADNFSDKLLISFYNNAWSKVFKRSFLLKNNLIFDKDLWRAQDALFVNSALAVAGSVRFINMPLVRYRIHKTQSWNYIDKHPFNGLDFVKKLRRFLEDKKIMDKLGRSFDNLCLSSMRYSLMKLSAHEEFDAVYMECKDILSKYRIPLEKRGYIFDDSLIDEAKIILKSDPATYYRYLVRDLNKQLDLARDEICKKEDVVNNIINSRSWRAMQVPRFLLRSTRLFIKRIKLHFSRL